MCCRWSCRAIVIGKRLTPGNFTENVHSPSLSVGLGRRGRGMQSAAWALPSSTEEDGWVWDHQLLEDGPASGCSYTPCGGIPAVVSEKPGDVGERSSFNGMRRRYLRAY